MLVVCNGMIRSGSTLQYNMVRVLVERLQLGMGEGYVETTRLDEHQSLFRDWAADRAVHVIKSHRLLPNAYEMTRAGEMKICYVYRDIRDVAVSIKRIWKREGQELLASLDGAVETYHKLRAFPEVLSQRYEEISSDPEAAVREIAAFLLVTPSPEVLATVVDECSIEKAMKTARRTRRRAVFQAKTGLLRIASILRTRRVLRGLGVSEERLRSLSERLHCYDEESLLHADHVSANTKKAGIWRGQLTADEVEMIMGRHEEWIREAGYPPV